MALYFYEAFAQNGKKVSGYIDAPSITNVKDQLVKQKMFPIKIVAGKSQAEGNIIQRLFRAGVSTKDKILFTKQLAVLLKSGIPILQAFELLTDYFEGRLQTILIRVKDDIKEGQSLADSLKNYPKTFDVIYVQLVRAGEASGNLEIILERLTNYLERREAIRKKISSALQYPMMQMIVAILVVGVLLYYVVPQMAENFASQDRELPGITQFLISISNLLTHHIVFVLFTTSSIIFGLRYWKSTPKGAYQFDQIKLKMPFIKYFAKTNAIVQFSYTLGILIEGGVNLAESLDIVCNIVDNRILADALKQARDKIIKQGKITQYLKQTNIFPPIAMYLIKTGEESGKLDTMLLTVAENYEEELSELANNSAAKLGPILLIVMAVIVGFIAIAIALPMMQMSELAGGM
jgi:type II secretory pathway component PulF